MARWRAWRDSNPQPSDPKFCLLTCLTVFGSVRICIHQSTLIHL
jgi:hypothetical protein